jgi:hypothetical protein
VSTTLCDSEPTSLQNNHNNNNNNHNDVGMGHLAPQQQQRSDLEDAFGESIDQEDMDDERQQLLSYPEAPHDSAALHPSPPPSSSQHPPPAVLQMTNDGVFANMSAKPESNRPKLDETPPVRPSLHGLITIHLTILPFGEVDVRYSCSGFDTTVLADHSDYSVGTG